MPSPVTEQLEPTGVVRELGGTARHQVVSLVFAAMVGGVHLVANRGDTVLVPAAVGARGVALGALVAD